MEITKTIDILSRIIQKTPLTAKLLSKPPFRYLHDLMSELLRISGAFKGLYTTDEMNSDNYKKDKDSKVQFLTKMIDCLKRSTGAELKVNPLKVVSGLEFEETNVMLQLIGKVILKKIDTSDAIDAITGRQRIQKVTELEEIPKPSKSKPKSNSDLSSSKPDLSSSKSDVTKLSKSKQSLSSRTDLKSASRPDLTSTTSRTDLTSTTSRTDLSKTRSKPDLTTTPSKSKSKPDLTQSPSKAELSKSANRPLTPLMSENSLISSTSIRERPTTARAPPPKSKAVLVESPVNMFNTYIPPVISPLQDDQDFVIKLVPDINLPSSQNEDELKYDANDIHGSLVTQILNTTQILTGNQGNVQVGSKDEDQPKSRIFEVREGIQKLCQSTNPLGKVIDYLQEDEAMMERELSRWRKEREEFEIVTAAIEKGENVQESEYLKRMEVVEGLIEEQNKRIIDLRRDIILKKSIQLNT